MGSEAGTDYRWRYHGGDVVAILKERRTASATNPTSAGNMAGWYAGDGTMPGTSSIPLRDFIDRHHDEIIGAFSGFARTLMPTGSDPTETDLRDHAKEMLTAIGRDLRTAQSIEERSEKSEGHGSANVMARSGGRHAEGRIQHGFTPGQVLAELRALRASVLRLYERSGSTDIAGVARFNEAIDEVVTESMTRYAAKTELYRDQFIGILSHDLRSPLSAITAGGALLAASVHDPRQARVAARILNSAQRMERMIADLLDLTRTRLGGAIPLNPVRTDLRQLCEEVLLEVQAAHPAAVVHFTSSDNVTGEWDSDRLAQVVSNLLGNAIQHGGGGAVTLQTQDAGESVTLSVHNDGTPIPLSAQASIFEPLARGGSDATQSIGLGLFIARAVVTAHSGEISVSSAEGAGTTLKVVLPKKSAPAQTQNSAVALG
jgi:signal transduction histidine kinase